jgi:hypothetical protein
MQIMPATARMLGFGGTNAELADPQTNIHYGVTYLAQAWRLAGGDICTAGMKYRAGHGETRFSSLSVNYCVAVRGKLVARGYRVMGDVPVATFGGPRAGRSRRQCRVQAAMPRRWFARPCRFCRTQFAAQHARCSSQDHAMTTLNQMRDIRIDVRSVIRAAASIALLVAMSVRMEAQTALPEITVVPPNATSGTKSNARGDADRKPGDGIGASNKSSLDRLNEQLKRKVDEANPADNSAPLDARSSDLKTGVVNMPGVKQQYGKNFGHSVIPYRPERPTFTPPLGHR